VLFCGFGIDKIERAVTSSSVENGNRKTTTRREAWFGLTDWFTGWFAPCFLASASCKGRGIVLVCTAYSVPCRRK
jgi:hypothetical protein